MHEQITLERVEHGGPSSITERYIACSASTGASALKQGSLSMLECLGSLDVLKQGSTSMLELRSMLCLRKPVHNTTRSQMEL